MISKEWSSLTVKSPALAKFLSDYFTANSAKHREFLRLLNLTKHNARDWFKKVLIDRCYLSIHAMELKPDGSLCLQYEVPVFLKFSNYMRSIKNSLSKRMGNTFQNDLLDYISMTVVIKIPYDPISRKYLKEESELFNAYLHNQPYFNYDCEALENKSPRSEFWGGTKEALQGSLESVGKYGLPPVKVEKWYTIPDGISPNNIVLHLYNNSNNKLIRREHGQLIEILSQDPSMRARAEAYFGMLARDLTSDLAAYHAQLN